MLDFAPVRSKQKTMTELADGLAVDNLRQLTNEMIDKMLALIANCVDADVVFVPVDPDAYDNAAATEDELTMPWTLGHLVVHTTASAEESAFLAAELARGVAWHGRSRYETHWQTIKTIDDCRARLEESRRMRLATLDVWPAQPHYENTYQPSAGSEDVNCVNRFIRGLSHDDAHLAQFDDVIRQAKAARN
jgi:hypothetical protein